MEYLSRLKCFLADDSLQAIHHWNFDQQGENSKLLSANMKTNAEAHTIDGSPDVTATSTQILSDADLKDFLSSPATDDHPVVL